MEEDTREGENFVREAFPDLFQGNEINTRDGVLHKEVGGGEGCNSKKLLKIVYFVYFYY